MNEQWSRLKDIISEVLKHTKTLGMDAAEAGVSYGSGLSATVRLGETETIEFNQDKSLGITVYKGKKKGSVSTSDINPTALHETIEAACRIATYTEEDPAAGLADKESMCQSIPDLDLYYPWDIKPEEAVVWAKDCEKVALSLDPRITNSDGATFSTHTQFRVYGNTHGFLGAYPSTRHSLSCSVIAKAGNVMQRDYDFTVAREALPLVSKDEIGKRSAERALRRLNAQKMKTCEAPVIFAAELAGGLISSFVAAISGGNLYRKSSFLLDYLGKRVFPEFVHIEEHPHLLKGLGSAPFDQEGVATRKHDIVREGILESYVLSSYSARKLGLKTTGNCGGVHNLIVSPGQYDLKALLKNMNKGLWVTELLGHGINLVTGDYSRGAAGFWVENGEIQYPVEEITIAGNLKDMFLNLVAIGNDVDKRSNILSGSLWIDRMTIAGN